MWFRKGRLWPRGFVTGLEQLLINIDFVCFDLMAVKDT